MATRNIPIALGLVGGGHLVQVTSSRGGRHYEIPHLDGTTVPSVTGIIDGTIRNRGLEFWKANVTKKELASSLGATVTEEMIATTLGRAESEGQKAADLGTHMHRIIELLLSGASMDTSGDEVILGDGSEAITVGGHLLEVIAGFLEWSRHFNWKHLSSEQAVYLADGPVQYAGTVDAIFWDDNKLIVVDWKSSGKIYETAYMQIASYVRALEAMQISHISGKALSNGGFAPKAVEGMVVRLEKEYPLGSDGRPMKDQPKEFTGRVEYSWVDVDHWYDAFLSAYSLSTLGNHKDQTKWLG